MSWKIKPTKIYSGTFESSLNGPGFSISLCNLTTAAAQSDSTTEELVGFLNYPTHAISWPYSPSTPANIKRAASPPTNGFPKKRELSQSENIISKPLLFGETNTLLTIY